MCFISSQYPTWASPIAGPVAKRPAVPHGFSLSRDRCETSATRLLPTLPRSRHSSFVDVNAGEKMHRRAGVKMHHRHSQVSATANAAFQFRKVRPQF